MISGSASDAFSDSSEIAGLRDLVVEAKKNGQKILGLCFGSQVAAHALGGKAGTLPTHLMVRPENTAGCRLLLANGVSPSAALSEPLQSPHPGGYVLLKDGTRWLCMQAGIRAAGSWAQK